MGKSEKPRVFVLGLDGATFDIIKPMIAQGRLPTFARLMKEGVHCHLRSTIVNNSAPAWTSFSTGKNPGKHSIGGFFRLIPNSYELKLLNGTDNNAGTVWDVVGNHGGFSIIMNIPMTYPPRPLKGLMVSGLDTPSLSCDFTYPAALKNELLSIVPDYKINLHLGGYLHNDQRRKKAIGIMRSCIRAREKAVCYLMKKYPWDFFAVRFNSPDNVQHQFWRYMDSSHPLYDPDSPAALKNAVFDIYEELDAVAASVMSKLPKDCTYIVMSDHGAGPRTNRTIRLNAWLKSRGYLHSRQKKLSARRYVYKMLERALGTFLKRVPSELKQWIVKVSPGTVSKTWTYFRFPNIDWTRTKAFVGETEGVRINLEGKYPSGIVKPEEYESLRSGIIEEIKKIRDPSNGESVFDGVYRREEVFSGPYVDLFPDVIALTTKDQYNISIKLGPDSQARKGDALIAEETHWRKVSGSHRWNGIFIMKGPGVKQDCELDPAQIVDVAPTALYALGIPVPSDMDGRVVSEALVPSYLKAHPPIVENVEHDEKVQDQVGDQYSEQERGELVDHLRGLGYIE